MRLKLKTCPQNKARKVYTMFRLVIVQAASQIDGFTVKRWIEMEIEIEIERGIIIY